MLLFTDTDTTEFIDTHTHTLLWINMAIFFSKSRKWPKFRFVTHLNCVPENLFARAKEMSNKKAKWESVGYWFRILQPISNWKICYQMLSFTSLHPSPGKRRICCANEKKSHTRNFPMNLMISLSFVFNGPSIPSLTVYIGEQILCLLSQHNCDAYSWQLRHTLLELFAFYQLE